ncbi:baseplate J/gp47 family protein [Thalassotalea sp. G20_0]|uniref:baseplate assembly protein n=1 Tax=Thalassotalea sp. G20_0 TaxID=2821093 RepID=UPI001ADB3B45|nr:baseplate J/gp47 family protein [Thalassotalea sp. G20_0]MBO9493849.1 baseplate J/gp47 family protein [Thalassotalea sp. G20_0]
MSFSVIDLSKLPPPKAIEELDSEAIFAEQMEDLRNFDPELADNMRVGDPSYNQQLVMTAREQKLRQRINEGLLAVLLPYAKDEDLDNLAAFWDEERLTLDEGDPDAIPPRPKVMESDDAFRYRIQLSMEGQSNAGTEGAYLYHALNSDERVKSAKPKSPAKGQVLIPLLSHEGDGTASADLLSASTTYMMQSHVRQMTDELTIQSAEIIVYRVRATIYVAPGPGADSVIEACREAVKTYVESLHRIGVLVPLSGIYGALQQPGVVRVVLHEPDAEISVSDLQAAYCAAIELTQEAI